MRMQHTPSDPAARNSGGATVDRVLGSCLAACHRSTRRYQLRRSHSGQSTPDASIRVDQSARIRRFVEWSPSPCTARQAPRRGRGGSRAHTVEALSAPFPSASRQRKRRNPNGLEMPAFYYPQLARRLRGSVWSLHQAAQPHFCGIQLGLY
jgi:hypothetical protein